MISWFFNCLERALIFGLFLLLATALLTVILPSVGLDPALGQFSLSLAVWRDLNQNQEFWAALKLSFFTGLSATLLSYWLATRLVILSYDSRWFRRLQALVSPILSIPHVATTVGILFVLAPSGWLIRLVSPWLTGFEQPPNWNTVQDPNGLALIIALVTKEMPYLVFVLCAALSQLPIERTLTTARLLGYKPIAAWHFTLLPQLYPMLRLPLFMVLTFNLTVVDVALLIGPNTPSTLAVTLIRWFNDPSLMFRAQASAAAVSLALLCLFSIAIVWLLFKTRQNHVYRLLTKGIRHRTRHWLDTYLGAGFAAFMILLTLISLLMLPVWAFAFRWRFPNVLPSEWSTSTFLRYGERLMELSVNSLNLAFASSVCAVIISLLLLEKERLRSASNFCSSNFYPSNWTASVLLILVLLPQVTFLFGLQIGLLALDWNGTWFSVWFSHLLYVLPYAYLTLKAPYLAFEQALLEEANRLRPTPCRNYMAIKLALLKAPLATALAIGFAVSMAQYLPTLIMGEGRITTLTTEAVARAASGDRKIISVLALAQAIMPLICFYLAMFIPSRWTQWRLALRKYRA